jgi:hypothetical protein
VSASAATGPTALPKPSTATPDPLENLWPDLRQAALARDFAGLKRLPRLGRDTKRAARVGKALDAFARSVVPGQELGFLRRFWLTAKTVFLVRRELGEQGLELIENTLRVTAQKVNEAERSAAMPSGYAAVSTDEAPVVRLALLLCIMGRWAAAVDILIQRMRSPLPSAESRYWLMKLFVPHLIKKQDKLAKYAPALPVAETGAPSRGSRKHAPRRLRYGVVVITMFDSEVFRASLNSLLASDFEGRVIVVEDGNESTPVCADFCARAGVPYLKSEVWTGPSGVFIKGIESLMADIDVVVLAHNDVLWPPDWFSALDRAWEDVFDSGKVSLLNISYMQIKRRTHAALYDLFLRNKYDDMHWLLNAMRETKETMHLVQDARVDKGVNRFGLARDVWSDSVPDGRMRVGTFSPVTSFPVRLVKEIGGFDREIPFGLDLEIYHHSIMNRRWMLWTNARPVIHMNTTDTHLLGPEKKEAYQQKYARTYELFERKFGHHIEHFLNMYFATTAVLYRDEVVRAADRLAFDEIDHVFDDVQERLRTATVKTCGLEWCRVREQCRYN